MNKILKDRFAKGLIAGILAGFLGALSWNIFSRFILHFATKSFWDFAAELMFRQKISNIWEGVFTFFLVKIFFGFCGIIFAFLIKTINSNLIILKGLIYGIAVWFVIYSMVAIFRIPLLTEISPQTCTSNFIEASIWGLLLGYFLNLLNKKSEELR